MADRRSFLTGLISLPLIGGGVTLIGQPAAAVPLLQAAALPTLDDPRQRARYAWEAFSAAMRDITADDDGWRILGAGESRGVGYVPPVSFLRVAALNCTAEGHPSGRTDLIVDRYRDIDLDVPASGGRRG